MAQTVHYHRIIEFAGLRAITRLKEESIMLVLSRKHSQKFRIGDDVTITIVKIDRNSVRIGIEAPGDVSVCRQELVEADRRKLVEAGLA